LVIARGAGKLALRRLRLHPADEECAPGWRYAYGEGVPHDLAVLVRRAASAGDGVAVGAWIIDTEHAQIVAVNRGSLAALGIGSDRGGEPLAHHPEAFAHWSWCTPRPVTALEVQQISMRNDVFAEETVDELFDQLGLPAPYDPLEGSEATRADVGATGFGGYLAPLGFMTDETVAGRQRAAWRDLRHVPGLGHGYLGIWDRESPDEPIATFIVSRRGEARVREELERLQPGAGVSRSWHDRFDRIDGSASITGERRAAAAFEGEAVVGVVVAVEYGHGGEAAAYLFRPGDGVRHLYSRESLEALTTMLERDLGEVELSEWIQVPDDAPDDLGGLGPVVLALAGL
jgi:hypothetical protein